MFSLQCVLLWFRLCRGAWPAAAPVLQSFAWLCCRTCPPPLALPVLLPGFLQDMEEEMEVPHRIDDASALQGWPLGHAKHAVVAGQATASLLGGKPLPLQEQQALHALLLSQPAKASAWPQPGILEQSPTIQQNVASNKPGRRPTAAGGRITAVLCMGPMVCALSGPGGAPWGYVD